MKNIPVVILTLLISILSACKSPSPIYVPVHDSTSVQETEAIEDEPEWTDPQSLLLQFAVECDSAYNAVLKQLHESNSGVDSEIQIRDTTIYLEDNKKVQRLEFSLSVYVDSIATLNRTIRQLRSEKRTVQVPYPVEVPTKFVPRYHKFTAWGFPALLILVIYVTYRRIRSGKSLRALF